jgi:hypothetical protein
MLGILKDLARSKSELVAENALCWLLGTSVQKKREICQEHHAGTTLSYWIHEPSPEKRAGLISTGPS